jgi:hypothetical protein
MLPRLASRANQMTKNELTMTIINAPAAPAHGGGKPN